MANNVFTGPNAAVCKVTTSFVSAGVTALNTAIIIEVGAVMKSYVPGRSINGITGFTSGKGYYMVMLQDSDFTAFLLPPVVIDAQFFLANFAGADGTLLTAYTSEKGSFSSLGDVGILDGAGHVAYTAVAGGLSVLGTLPGNRKVTAVINDLAVGSAFQIAFRKNGANAGTVRFTNTDDAAGVFAIYNISTEVDIEAAASFTFPLTIVAQIVNGTVTATLNGANSISGSIASVSGDVLEPVIIGAGVIDLILVETL